MNRYDEIYEIRLARKDDIENIMLFINTYWKENHILATNREFFEYEFLEDNGDVNFALAVKRETQSLEGVQGFLKTSQDESCMDVWGCIWRVKEGNMPFLGMELVARMEHMSGCRYHLGAGLNPKTTVPLLKGMWHCVIGKMKQYYFLGRCEEFKVAKIVHFPEQHGIQVENVDVRQIVSIKEIQEKFDFEKYKENVPYKDAFYIDKRFFRHPIYRYSVYGIFVEDYIKAFFVIREEEGCGRKVLRIVDFVGEQKCFGNLYIFFRNLVQEGEYEYIDFYCENFEEDYLLDAGFVLRTENDTNIIPNYFHPFEQRNVEISTHAPLKGALFCKADADQDRPN